MCKQCRANSIISPLSATISPCRPPRANSASSSFASATPVVAPWPKPSRARSLPTSWSLQRRPLSARPHSRNPRKKPCSPTAIRSADFPPKASLRTAVEQADLIINMSGRRSTAFSTLPLRRRLRLAKKIENWHVEDPYGEDPATYQRILEELETRVLLLASRLRDRRRAASGS